MSGQSRSNRPACLGGKVFGLHTVSRRKSACRLRITSRRAPSPAPARGFFVAKQRHGAQAYIQPGPLEDGRPQVDTHGRHDPGAERTVRSPCPLDGRPARCRLRHPRGAIFPRRPLFDSRRSAILVRHERVQATRPGVAMVPAVGGVWPLGNRGDQTWSPRSPMRTWTRSDRGHPGHVASAGSARMPSRRRHPRITMKITNKSAHQPPTSPVGCRRVPSRGQGAQGGVVDIPRMRCSPDPVRVDPPHRPDRIPP